MEVSQGKRFLFAILDVDKKSLGYFTIFLLILVIQTS